jgi:hypothetical protein
LIESIYIDTREHSTRVSTYTILLEKLAAAERAKNVHIAMHTRVLCKHDALIQEARAAFEAEGARLRGLIKAAKA